MAGLSRYVTLLLVQLRQSLLAAMQYRVGFWSEGVLGLLWSLGGVIPLVVAVGHRREVAGWGPLELLVLVGCFTVVQGVFGAFLQPSLVASMQQIRRGTLDYVLLRPADALFLCLTGAFNPWRLVEVLGGLAMVALALVQLGHAPSLADVAGAVFVMGLGIAMLYALGVIMLAVSFWALKLENLTFFMESLMDFARWPGSVFRGPVKALFTYVVPLVVMTTYPAQAILGQLSPSALGGAIAVAAVLLTTARVLWSRALRGYTSASS